MENRIKFIRISIAITLLLSGFSTIINGQTILSGIIGVDSTLSLANSPYLVTGNLLVSPNVTLTVEPGVVVKFNPNTQILLRGALIANGTLQDTILFTSDISNQQSWSGIKIDNYGGAKIVCSYFRGRFAHYLFDHSRTIGSDTAVKATHCLLDSNAIVLNMFVSQNTTTKQYFDSCLITNNGTICTYASNCNFKNSTFSNGYSGIRNFSPFALWSTIENCSFDNFNHIATGESVTLLNCVLSNNDIAVALSQNTVLHNNNIYNNAIGISCYTNTLNSSGYVTQNRICNNIINLKLNYSADFIVSNNCWCLNDSAQIAATIYDFFDAPGLGFVSFVPFDTLCSNSTSLQNSNNNIFEYKVYPNPAQNVVTVELFENNSMAVINIINAMGTIEYSFEFTTQQAIFDISKLSAGVYFMELSLGGDVSRKRIIKN